MEVAFGILIAVFIFLSLFTTERKYIVTPDEEPRDNPYNEVKYNGKQFYK